MKRLLTYEDQMPIPMDFVRFWTYDDHQIPGEVFYEINFLCPGEILSWIWLDDKEGRDECYQKLLERFGENL